MTEYIPDECPRCAGSGSVGRRISNHLSEAPGPVPEDAAGWYEIQCPDCDGKGMTLVPPFGDEEEDGDGDD